MRAVLPRLLAVALLAFFALTTALSPALAAENEAVGAALAKLVQSGEFATGSALANRERERLTGFYAGRAYKPVWARDDGPKGKAKALFSELKISAVHGLSPDFYGANEIEPLMASTKPEDLARFDLLMTGALIEFSEDLANGRIGPQSAGSENAVAPIALDPVEVLAAAEESGNLRSVVGGHLNVDFRYVRLIAKYAELERIRRAGLWPEIADGGEIRPGDKDARIPAIRKMLALNGDLAFALAKGGDRLDANLQQALRAFQARHRIAETGQVDARTLAELRVPLETRMRQVQINLERRRWQNRDLGNDHIYINVADSSLKLVRAGKSEWFGTLVDSEDLSGLPTFYGKVSEIEFDAREPGRSRLLVQSEFVDSIGSEPGPRRLAIVGMAEIAKALVAGNAEGDAASTGQSRKLRLEPPVTLYVTYLTAWANRDGSLQLRPDKFARDEKLAELLKLK